MYYLIIKLKLAWFWLISLGIISIWCAILPLLSELGRLGLAACFVCFMRAGIIFVGAECVLPGGTTRPKGNSFFVPAHL